MEHVPMDISERPDSVENFALAMKKIMTNKNKTDLKTSVKTLLSTLQNLQKKPSDVKNRKIRMDNIVIKKYVAGVPGAQEFLEAVGFRVREEQSKKYLEIDPEALNQTLLGKAIDYLAEKQQDMDTPEQPVSVPVPSSSSQGPRPQKLCVAGCPFFGDEKTDGMCSLCYRKKHGQPTAESKSTLLCLKGCGYYGLDKFKGMCSLCYGKDTTARRSALKRRWRLALTKIKAVRRFRLSLKPVQKNPSRCWSCNRKIGITGIECRCGYLFCGKHRYASEHDCPYDFKKAHKNKLVKENLKLTGKKMDKIDSDGD